MLADRPTEGKYHRASAHKPGAGATRALLARVRQDEHGGFAADALRVAVEETVEDEVSRDHQAAAGEAVHEGEEALSGDGQRHLCGL